MKMVRYYIGTSGWYYDDWRGCFYPEKLPKAKWLEFYARHYSTLELNNTFYRVPPESIFNNWRLAVPRDFIFSLKGSRLITHIKRLKDCRDEVELFISRAALLGEKLGPLLFQLPPGLPRDDDLLDTFLFEFPRPLKRVIEFRHESWFVQEVYEVLRKHKAGFCIFDMPKRTSPVLATTDFAYLRFHGNRRLYSSCYTDEELAGWAAKIKDLCRSLKSCFIYFNNDTQGHALRNAETLKDQLTK